MQIALHGIRWLSRNQLRRLPLSLLSSAGHANGRRHKWRRGGDVRANRKTTASARAPRCPRRPTISSYLRLGAGKTSPHAARVRAKAFYRPFGPGHGFGEENKASRFNEPPRWLKVKARNLTDGVWIRYRLRFRWRSPNFAIGEKLAEC